MSTKQKLFSEFPPITTQQWEDIILKELKGADYEKKLIWKSNEGIAVKPYYRKEDIATLPWIKQTNQSELPICRTYKTNDNNWVIFEEVYVGNIDKANQQAVEALSKGAEGIEFIIQEKIHYDLVNLFQNQEEFSRLVKGINLEKTPLRFVSGCSTGVILSMLEEEVKKQQLDATKIDVTFDYDPLGHLTLNGNFFVSEENCYQQMVSLFNYYNQICPNGKVFGVNGYYFQNAGATLIQEISLSLAIASEYFKHLSDVGLNIRQIAEKISFNLGVGSNYFMEIAKYRAIRYLWTKLLEAFDEKSTDVPLYIHSITSNWNKTAYDPYVNILRNTTEAMSAVIGGSDSITVRPFDAIYKSPDAFSLHIARNIQLILKEESHLDKVIDPAGGSYYIESLTQSFINEGWKMFMQIEEWGGYVEAFKQGKIQEMIEATQQKRDMNLAMRQEILLGTNQYPNSSETISNHVVPCLMAGLMPSGKPVVNKPIRIYRGAQAFEELRLATEQLKKRPTVFLFTIGNIAMRKARANFSSNFFGCAGFEIIDNNGFSSVQEGINEVKRVKPEFVVLCSSDEEYPEIVQDIMNALKNDTIIILAGYPKEHIEEFKSLGLKYFIHIKSNVLETLKEFQSLVTSSHFINN
ncbi:MAG TPA: methylmalonyl-CoA mutase family protein [Bacteroidales bacterium]|nr:methylmalonyl-CoA mutase family protein [Bacteroidales bacterium]